MSNYHQHDLEDPEQEVVRSQDVKKHSAFHYCKWAAGDEEARFYAWTPTHRKECEFTINQMVNNPAWFKTRKPKIDKVTATRNNRARHSRK